MAKGHGKGVSGHTHTKAQLDHYANQHNPNNRAYRAEQNNRSNQCNPNNPTHYGKHYFDRTEFQVEAFEQDD